MDSSLLLYLIVVVVLVLVAAMAGRMVRQRRQGTSATPSGRPPAPVWISRRPENLEDGVEYCELRADFNYTDTKPATSRVTASYFSRNNSNRQVLAQEMTEQQFDQERATLRKAGWTEAYTSSDREGNSHYFRRVS